MNRIAHRFAEHETKRERVQPATSFARWPRTNKATISLLLGFGLTVFAYLGLAASAQAQQSDPCAAPANEVVAENCKPGDPQSEWDVQGAGDPHIQGFATDISVNQGQSEEHTSELQSRQY